MILPTMNVKKIKSLAVRRHVRIGKLTRTEKLMEMAINAHRSLEPMKCDFEFMGTDWSLKRSAYLARHDRLLQALAEVTGERMALQGDSK